MTRIDGIKQSRQFDGAPPNPMLPLWFSVLIVIQCLVIVAHDLVDIPGWAHGRQIRAALGAKKFWIATSVNAIFPGVAAGLAVGFWHSQPPAFAIVYWLVYCAITVGSAVAMWWIPYWFGAPAATKRLYADMYAGTRHLLRPRGDNPRPNLLHLCFHALFAVNLGLAVLVWISRR